MAQGQRRRLGASEWPVALLVQMHLGHLGVCDGHMPGAAVTVRMLSVRIVLTMTIQRMGVAICGRQCAGASGSGSGGSNGNSGSMKINSRGARDAAQLHIGRGRGQNCGGGMRLRRRRIPHQRCLRRGRRCGRCGAHNWRRLRRNARGGHHGKRRRWRRRRLPAKRHGQRIIIGGRCAGHAHANANGHRRHTASARSCHMLTQCSEHGIVGLARLGVG